MKHRKHSQDDTGLSMHSIYFYNMRCSFYVYICLLWLCTHLCNAQVQQLRVDGMPMLNRKVEASVYCFIEDQNGFMWLGTEDGLFQYDGYDIKHYQSHYKDENSLSDSFILSLFQDDDGYIWVGTRRGICIIDPIKNTIQRIYQQEIPKRINVIYQDRDQYIWIGSDEGLFRINHTKRTVQTFQSPATKSKNHPDTKDYFRVYSILQDHTNQVLLGTNQGLYQVTSQNVIQEYSQFSILHQVGINTLYEDPYHQLWIGTSFLFVLDANRNKIQKQKDIKQVRTITGDQQGIVYIGTRNGLFVIDKKDTQVYQKNDASFDLMSNNIRHAYLSANENILWLGIYPGFASKIHLKTSKFIRYHLTNDDDFMWGIHADSTGQIWVGCYKGDIYQIDPSSQKVSLFPTTFPKGISGISSDNNGHIWLIGNEIWQTDITGTNIQKSPHKQLKIRASCDDQQGNIWLGTVKGLKVFNKASQATQLFLPKDSTYHKITTDFIYTIYFTPQNELLIGTSQSGLYRLNLQSHQITLVPHTKEMDIYNIYQDQNQDLWLGTNIGLGYVTKDTLIFYDESNGLSHNTVYALSADNHQRLWMSTDKGISSFDIPNKKFTNYSVSEGVLHNEFSVNSVCKAENGFFYFGGTLGVTAFHPDSIQPVHFNNQTLISDFLLFNKPVSINDSSILTKDISYTDTLQLDYSDYLFGFKFGCINQQQFDPITFSYQLEGFDQDWLSPLGDQTMAIYTNIPPNTYTFRVKALSTNGQAGPESKITVIITPPFWKTKLFILISIASLCLLGYLFVKYREKQLVKQNHLLEGLVSERTERLQIVNTELKAQKTAALMQNEKILSQKEELEQTLNHLQATQNQLIKSEKMVALGQLVAGVAHEVNTPLGIIQSSANSSNQLLQVSLEKLPKLFKLLSERQQEIFFELIEEGFRNDIVIGAKEERKLKKEVRKVLDVNNMNHTQSMASTLVEMGVYENVDQYMQLLAHEEGFFILKTAYQIVMQKKNNAGIEVAVQKASRIVYALKTYVHQEQVDVAKTLTDIKDNLETVLTIYRNHFKHGIQLSKDFAQVPHTLAYPDSLVQVWTNLITNAIQAMNGKGELSIQLQQIANHILVSVKDNGKGMTEITKVHIFDPFFTTKATGEGSGLGLDITRKIVEERHQGRIWCESEVGKGTTFYVQLPIVLS